MDMTIYEEILDKYEPNREYPSYYHEGDILAAMEELENQIRREYGELKQSPRWVKYSTRKPEKPGWHHVEAFYGEGAGHYHYFNGSDFESQNKPLIPVEHSKWLDESGSPEPEAKDVTSESKMNLELLKERMRHYFDNADPDEIIAKFEKMGYTFVPTNS